MRFGVKQVVRWVLTPKTHTRISGLTMTSLETLAVVVVVLVIAAAIRLYRDKKEREERE